MMQPPKGLKGNPMITNLFYIAGGIASIVWIVSMYYDIKLKKIQFKEKKEDDNKNTTS